MDQELLQEEYYLLGLLIVQVVISGLGMLVLGNRVSKIQIQAHLNDFKTHLDSIYLVATFMGFIVIFAVVGFAWVGFLLFGIYIAILVAIIVFTIVMFGAILSGAKDA